MTQDKCSPAGHAAALRNGGSDWLPNDRRQDMFGQRSRFHMAFVGGLLVLLLMLAGCGENQESPSSPAERADGTHVNDDSVDAEYVAFVRGLIQATDDYEQALRNIAHRHAIDFMDRIDRMSEDELGDAYTAGILPWAEEVEQAYQEWDEATDEIMAGLSGDIAAQEERALLEESTGTQLFLNDPQTFENGWQGEDALSGEWIYIETTRHAPQTFGNTLDYMPIQGIFIRDGEIEGRNAFGTQLSIPRFVDTPAIERQRLQAMFDLWNRNVDQMNERMEASIDHECKEAAEAYSAMQDRFLVLSADKSLLDAHDLWAALRLFKPPIFAADHEAFSFYDRAILGSWKGHGKYTDSDGAHDCTFQMGVVRADGVRRTDDASRLPSYSLRIRYQYVKGRIPYEPRNALIVVHGEITESGISFRADDIDSDLMEASMTECLLSADGTRWTIGLSNERGDKGLTAVLERVPD